MEAQLKEDIKDPLDVNSIFQDPKKYGFYTKKDLEVIIRESWFRGNRHLLNDDGKNSLFNVYRDFGLIN